MLKMPPGRLSRLAPITEDIRARTQRLFAAWQLATNLNDSQAQLIDAVGRDPLDSERILAEVILRARMQDALATLLHPGQPVDNDRAVLDAIVSLGFPLTVRRNAYYRAHLVGGGRIPADVSAVGASTMWADSVEAPASNANVPEATE